MTRTETAILVGAMTLGLLGALAVADPAPATLRGEAAVVDGDTIRVGAVMVRLWGIDAPEEAAQTCQRAQGPNLGLLDAPWARKRSMLRAIQCLSARG